MDDLFSYGLFLFDFDGLLVNTEELHFEAYKRMCQSRGFTLDWSLREFFKVAHLSATGLKIALYEKFPELLRREPNWDVLYTEKKKHYRRLLEEGRISLMPGVAEFLQALQDQNMRRCVVTHSPKEQVDAIKAKLPILGTIPEWITREQYKEPKPHPDSYRMAIGRLAKPKDKIIGFEDSMRGLKALLGAGATQAVLVCPADHPQMAEGVPEGVFHCASIVDFYQK